MNSPQRYAIISPAGRVTNTIAWDGADAEHVIPPGHSAVESEAAGIGDSYAGGVFTPAPVVAPVESAAAAELKPAVDALLAAGILSPERAAQILAS